MARFNIALTHLQKLLSGLHQKQSLFASNINFVQHVNDKITNSDCVHETNEVFLPVSGSNFRQKPKFKIRQTILGLAQPIAKKQHVFLTKIANFQRICKKTTEFKKVFLIVLGHQC